MAEQEFKIVKFGDSEIPVPSNLSVAEIKELLAPAFPRISSAHAIEENGVVKFFLEAGEKGSEEPPAEGGQAEFKIVKFGDSEIPVPSNLSVAEIKELLAPAFPRISSAHAIEENGVVKFFLEAGEKGASETDKGLSQIHRIKGQISDQQHELEKAKETYRKDLVLEAVGKILSILTKESEISDRELQLIIGDAVRKSNQI